ncbi:hypothetical protein PsorP6_015245 [Peronosclerospora sorghi]|uniref:Uncharacterized protein n=1 Tax=Peronosclerospora sorghi TaxID=230839 RepID=A0ACC0VTJ8_9STRA|nr:hypothetical protein PsorP6_015245 [Peronosclerospora sorghi]
MDEDEPEHALISYRGLFMLRSFIILHYHYFVGHNAQILQYQHDPNTHLQSGGHRNIFSFSRRQRDRVLLIRTSFHKFSIIEDGKSCGRFALSFNRKRCIAINNQTIVLDTITNRHAIFFR